MSTKKQLGIRDDLYPDRAECRREQILVGFTLITLVARLPRARGEIYELELVVNFDRIVGRVHEVIFVT